MVDAGFTIVSGLAPGIDTFAHTTVIERKKRAIAVLGTGIDEKTIYPRENLQLAKKIIENDGCIISEYPPGTRGTKFTFPNRNRIIAGVSIGVLVVEAKEKSGALITADWAFSQKKKVFAVPGPIYSLVSKGPHKLIKNGAKLAENSKDILLELGFEEKLLDNKEITGETEEENLILKILQENSLDVDKIIEKTKLPAQIIASTLVILEIKGKVKNLGANIYAISHC